VIFAELDLDAQVLVNVEAAHSRLLFSVVSLLRKM
jgi:hypothetical protein